MPRFHTRSQRVLFWLGILWSGTGNIERIIGWVSGALSKDTEDAVSKVNEFFDAIPLLGDPVAQTVMTTGGLILISVAVAMWFCIPKSEGAKASFLSPMAIALESTLNVELFQRKWDSSVIN